MTHEHDHALFKELLSGILSHPQKAVYNTVNGDRSSHLSIDPAREDFPRLIGRARKNFNALAALFALMEHRQGRDGRFYVVTPFGESEHLNKPFVRNTQWQKLPLAQLIERLLLATGLDGEVDVDDLDEETTVVAICFGRVPPPIELPCPIADAFRNALVAWGKNQGRNLVVEINIHQEVEP